MARKRMWTGSESKQGLQGKSTGHRALMSTAHHFLLDTQYRMPAMAATHSHVGMNSNRIRPTEDIFNPEDPHIREVWQTEGHDIKDNDRSSLLICFGRKTELVLGCAGCSL